MSFPGKPTPGSRTGRPIMALLDSLGKRWALRIIWEIGRTDGVTFRDLRTRCEDVSPTSLMTRLKELRELDIVELGGAGYALTESGQELSKLLMPLDAWAETWAKALAVKD